MNIDLGTDLLTKSLLQRLDPNHTGAFVEVGLGTSCFSFAWAAPEGFHCYAVEPLPSEVLTQACRTHHVSLTVAAVTEQHGEIPIYVGRLGGRTFTDTSSLNPNWWGCGTERRMVPTLSLGDFFAGQQIACCSLLKVDTEGTERDVLGGLTLLAEKQRPKIIVFEYGGGGLKCARQKGWTDEFFANTLQCVELLRGLGYRRGFLIEYASAGPRFVELEAGVSPADLFPENAHVGNFLLIASALSPDDAAEIIRPVAQALAADARRVTRHAHVARLSHYPKRLLAGLRRRLPGRKPPPNN